MPSPASSSRLASIALALLALAGLLGAAQARADSQSSGTGSASAGVMFVIHIPPVLRLKTDAPPSLRVTSVDIARGYVDTSVPQEVLVTCNTQREYALRIELRVPRFGRVTMLEQQRSQSFGAEGLTLYRPRASPGVTQASYRFNYRFELPADMAPGDYPWPLAVSLIQV